MGVMLSVFVSVTLSSFRLADQSSYEELKGFSLCGLGARCGLVYGIGPPQHGSGWVTAAGWDWMGDAGRSVGRSRGAGQSHSCEAHALCMGGISTGLGEGCDVRGRVWCAVSRPR